MEMKPQLRQSMTIRTRQETVIPVIVSNFMFKYSTVCLRNALLAN